MMNLKAACLPLLVVALPASLVVLAQQCDEELCICTVAVSEGEQPPYNCPDWMSPSADSPIYTGLASSDCVAEGGTGAVSCIANNAGAFQDYPSVGSSCIVTTNNATNAPEGIFSSILVTDGNSSDPSSPVVANYTETDPAPECSPVPPFTLAPTAAPTSSPAPTSTSSAFAKRTPGYRIVALAASSIALFAVFA